MAGFYSEVSEQRFKLPDMGEYYDQELVEDLLKEIDPEDPKNAAYYVEEPFKLQPGFYPDYQAFVLKATPQIASKDDGGRKNGLKNEELNAVDGDTMTFPLSSVYDGGMPFTIKGITYKSFKDYAYAVMSFNNFKSNALNVRTIGVNAPEIAHYTLLPFKKNEYKPIEKRIKDAKNETMDVVYDKTNYRADDDIATFVYANDNKNKLVEVIKTYNSYPYTSSSNENIFNELYFDSTGDTSKSENNDTIWAKVVSTDEQEPKTSRGQANYGLEAKNLLIEVLNKAEDIRVVLDAKQLQYKPGFAEGIYSEYGYAWSNLSDISEFIRMTWNRAFGKNVYLYKGFNAFGQDSYRRFLGAIYVKVKVENSPTSMWINVSKYLIYKLGDNMKLMIGETPTDLDNNNSLSKAFKLWSYDPKNTQYADGFFDVGKNDFDDRRAIQKEITGYDFSILRDYTVMIGDCLFTVPPTSIRVVNQIESQRVQLLRSKGSMTREKPHNDRIIEMTLYFNSEHGINGTPINKSLPSGKQVTYHMNGLRSLLAMFKTTPFLPIENAYINDTLNIEAVALANMQIQTMPSYPKCMAVTLTLQQFNYRVFMNELPIPDPDNGESFDKNIFASTINYGVMRYYYQRAIQRGEEIKTLDPLSDEYIHKTMGNKTSLIPMGFKDQTIKFYKLDNNWLDDMLATKQIAARRPINQTSEINENMINWATQVGVSMAVLLKELKGFSVPKNPIGNKEAENKLTEISNRVMGNNSCPLLTYIAYAKEKIDGKNTDVINIKFQIDSITTGEIQNLMKAVYKELEVAWKDYYILSQGIISIPLSEADGRCTINDRSDEYLVGTFFAYRSGYIDGKPIEGINDGNWSDFAILHNEEILEELKDQAIDKETVLSAKFVRYPMDDIVVQQFSVSMGNTLANTKLKAQEGYAPQYAGGQDVVVEFLFHTRNSDTVNAINAMNQIASQDLVKYRQVIQCWPIRIDSELTRLCGVNEVIIESVDISTVPMQPGLFAIHCRALSLDRTMRNREALAKLDTINNSGATNPDGIGSIIYRTYFELDNVLAQAEVYPDLELPTLQELDMTGYKFIRYMQNRKDRVYPDPDFYFVYGHIYTSQMLRKVITDFFDNKNGEQQALKALSTYSDNTSGQVVEAKYDKDSILSFSYTNSELKNSYDKYIQQTNEQIDKIRMSSNNDAEKLKAELVATENSYKKLMSMENDILTNNSMHWNVCQSIKCNLGDIGLKYEKGSEVRDELDLKNAEVIKIIDDVLSQPIIFDSSWTKISDLDVVYKKRLENNIKKFVEKELEDGGTWFKILKQIGVDTIPKDAIDTIRGIYEAAAMAMSGETEYASDASQSLYEPRAVIRSRKIKTGDPLEESNYELPIVPYCVISDNNTGEIFTANTVEQGVEKGIAFGAYQIRKYDREFLREFYGNNKSFSEFDFLDPYYNSTMHYEKLGKQLSKSVKNDYSQKILEYTMYSITAFHRNVLAWLKKLVEANIYISFFDLKRKDYITQYNEIINELGNPENELPGYLTGYASDSSKNTTSYTPNYTNSYTEQAESVNPVAEIGKEMKELLSSYEDELVSGKVFLPIVCAVIAGEPIIYSKILNRDAGSLNIKTQSCEQVLDISTNIGYGERYFRKLIRGLCATDPKVIKSIADIASSSPSKLDEAMQDRLEKLWLSASEDPTLWLAHSYYDMIVNNKRGRMARAFPTYYMLLVDEGREIGYWKLHDNFYNMSAIAELEVIKSRKIPADTAKIVLTNMFKSFSTEDEDIKTDYQSNIRDVFTSIFNPHAQYEKEELRRMQQMDVNRVRLMPGARVHLRMGYSGDASTLPILFNGRIAEVSSGELIEVVAQSDAHEITNPSAFASVAAADLADLKNEKIMPGVRWFMNFFNEGATPKQLINNILTTKGGFTKNIINWVSNGRFYNDNMFGVVNFGEIDYKIIHKNGEVMQNIYEAEGSMPWTSSVNAGSTAELHSLPDPPKFTVELKDKSVWDVLNICAGTSLNFMTAIAPFGVRSTIFYGRPHYYYAYDYAINDTGQIMEKRKPYQQYHLIDSYSDIIGNNILASGKDIRTCAVPIYEGPNAFNKVVEKKLPSPLWIDFDIYPEYQKTTVVNTHLTYKANKLGAIIYNKFKDEWSDNGGQKIAWRMGAKALKDSVKDMYQGEVTIIGDPAIKPFDKIYLHDIYENMNGCAEVEAVVHRMTPEAGYSTSVYVDCISTVDNRYEQIGQMWNNNIMTQVIAAKGTMFVLSKFFDTTTKPMLQFIANAVTKGVYTSTKAINAAAELVGQDNLIKYGKVQGWTNDFYNVIGMTTGEIELWGAIDNFRKWKDILGYTTIDDVKKLDDVLDVLNNTIKTLDKTDPIGLAKNLQKMLDDKTITSNVDDVAEVIKELTANGNKVNTGMTTTLKTMGRSVIDEATKTGNLTDEMVVAIKEVESIISKSSIDVADAKKAMTGIKKISSKAGNLIDNSTLVASVFKHVDDVKDVMNASNTIIKGKNIAKALKTGASFIVGGPVGAILSIIAEVVLEYVLVKNVYNWIEMKMASFNVLQIYPLKKNGIAYVAGIDGHKGLVVGSPTYSQNGMVDNFINWVFKDRGPAYDIFKNVFFSENMMAIAETYKKNNQFGEYVGDTGKSETSIQEMLKTMAENQASNYSSYKSMLIPSRLTNLGEINAKFTYNKNRVKYDEHFETNDIILNELVPITIDNEALRPFFERKDIKSLHDGNIEGANAIERFSMKFNTKTAGEINVYCIDISSSDKRIIDIPFLRPDAFQLFFRIIEEVALIRLRLNYGDEVDNTVYFKSGTTVGSNTWASTGYSFRVQVANIDDMSDIFKTLSDELKELYVEGNNKYEIFQYKKLSDGKTYEVFVSPRDEYIRFEDLNKED